MEQRPGWLKVKFDPQATAEVAGLMERLHLSTVCKEANCPNLGECYKKQTATFMIMGNQCTRNCRFCNVINGQPTPLDPEEPMRLAQAVQALKLRHVVITSVTRDDLTDGGAAHFAATVRAVKQSAPDVTVEVLIPDMKASPDSLDSVIAAAPDLINHNIETVPSLYPMVRPEAVYSRSLEVLRYVKQHAPQIYTKTGIMAGLGETEEQVGQVMDDAIAAGCDIFTIGQYLRPSPAHIEMKEYIHPSQFERYREMGEQKGFVYVASGPLVRSSYRAGEALSQGQMRKKHYDLY